MTLSKQLRHKIIVLLFTCLLTGCKKAASKMECGEVSVHLLFSLTNINFQDLEIKSSSPKRKLEELTRIFANLRNQNGELLNLAGGLKSGLTPELMNPCMKGDKVVSIFKRAKFEKTYKSLVNHLKIDGLINEAQASNMLYIINTYFNNENGVLSDQNLNSVPIGFLILENLSLQLVIINFIHLP